MKTPIAIIISGIVIAISIVVSTIIYVDANKYTFLPHNNNIIALSKDGELYTLYNQYYQLYALKSAFNKDNKESLKWRKQKNIILNLP